MNITHICLSGMITEGWAYQENMFIKYHMAEGHTVTVITSQWIRKGNSVAKYEKTNYIGEYGARYIRLPISNKDSINYRFKQYSGLEEAIEQSNPDCIFVHNFQFLDIKTIANYIKKNRIPLYVDNHSDFSNSATNFISLFFLHKMLWRYHAHLIEPYVTLFFGVLPARVDFLKNVYALPSKKCELLVMGADDELVEKAKMNGARTRIRKQFGIKDDDFLLMTGGKIDKWKKQTVFLMQAAGKLPDKLKLIVFGSISQELEEQVRSLADGTKIQFIGWLQAKDTYDYVEAADLFVFPGRHSVLWEQVTGQGVPMIVKDWPGTHHIDLGGNVRFLENESEQVIAKAILEVFNNKDLYNKMKEVAITKGMLSFSYKRIAERAISGSIQP